MDYPLDTNGVPSVALGGLLWPVPVLAAKLNRVTAPLILSLLPIFKEWQGDKALVTSKIGAPYHEVLQKIAFQGVSRAHPEPTRERIMELPTTLHELTCAFAGIAQQTGIRVKNEPGEAPLGEAQMGDT